MRSTHTFVWRACGPLGEEGKCEDTSRSGRDSVPCTPVYEWISEIYSSFADYLDKREAIYGENEPAH